MGKEKIQVSEPGQVGEELVKIHPGDFNRVSFLIPKSCQLTQISWQGLSSAHKRMARNFQFLKDGGWKHFKAKSGRNRPAFLSLREDGNNITLAQKMGLSSYNQQLGLLPGETLTLKFEKDRFTFEEKE